MAPNPIVYTEHVVRSFLRYQLTVYPFADERLHGQMRRLLSLVDRGSQAVRARAIFLQAVEASRPSGRSSSASTG